MHACIHILDHHQSPKKRPLRINLMLWLEQKKKTKTKRHVETPIPRCVKGRGVRGINVQVKRKEHFPLTPLQRNVQRNVKVLHSSIWVVWREEGETWTSCPSEGLRDLVHIKGYCDETRRVLWWSISYLILGSSSHGWLSYSRNRRLIFTIIRRCHTSRLDTGTCPRPLLCTST